ncbi:MAG: dTDP-6-deoxy-3,4-keto-hexulose isomerase [Acidobacteria bacterium]|nr:MAG: dTDP-6-deoxy-3,4-keto-hexulose isomerase [Acidobacteriota bacterium]
MREYPKPHLIEFPKFGDSAVGYVSAAESSKNIPFEVKRVFWTYYTPESIVRGRHAHHETEQILLAVAGRIIVTTETREGEVETFVLDNPHIGVYIPPDAWHTMQYSHVAVQLVLTSTYYDEADYIRDYKIFKSCESQKR